MSVLGDPLGRAARHAAFALKRATVLRESDRAFRTSSAGSRLPTEVLLERQRRAAIGHARYAMENTAFYRRLYADAGLTLDDLRDPEAFAALPIVEKDDVRAHFADFRTPDARPENTALSRTGGSTGRPLELLRDTRVSARPLEWQLFSWWGVHPSDDIAVVARHTKTGAQRRRHAAKWWPSRRIQLDAYRIGDVAVREFADEWSRVRPRLLTGYAGGILELTRTVQRLGLNLAPPTAIATTASPLTSDQRHEIEATLGAPVYDHYRSSEIPWMGGECRERAGHHLFAAERVIELVDEHGTVVPDGEQGQVVATDLTNRVFPLIRYRLGDHTRAIPETCACGVNLPRIERVSGRQSDGLRMPDGTWVAGEGLYQIFDGAAGAVCQFQLDQAPDYSVLLRCVRGPLPSAEAAIDGVVDRLRSRLQEAVPVRWEFVEEIPHEGGKIRIIQSAVA